MRSASKTSLVSIIVPVYNAESFLEDTIKTVLDQSYKDWELILINDCSTDNSELVYEQYKNDRRIHWVDLKKNSGPAVARNYGVDLAKGRFVCFIDADDKWDCDKLEKQVAFMKQKKCAFSYHSYEFANENCEPNGKKVIAREQLRYKQALGNNIISTITVMFDVSLISKELIKMPDLDYVEDTATWWQVLRNGFVAYGIPSIFSYYRRSANTNSSNKLRTQKSLWHTYRKVEGLNPIQSFHYLFWKNGHALMRRI